MQKIRRITALLLALLCILTQIPFQARAGQAEMPFEDVKPMSWMCPDVSYCYANGLMNGRSATMFYPYRAVTRAEFVTILGRVYGVDPSEWKRSVKKPVFSDVDPDSYYAPYVNWAVRYGITKGLSDVCFGPRRKISRQDAAVMIARSEKLADASLLTPVEEPIVFPDEDSISDYARSSVSLLQRQGILKGDGEGLLHPRGTVSRAETASMVARYHCRLQSHTHEYRQTAHYTSSCTSRPKRRMTCSCGSYYLEYAGDPPGHKYEVTGYTEDRQAVKVCTRCGYTEYEPLPEAKRIYSADTLLRYGQITSVLDKLAARYPDLIRLSTAGKSANSLKIPLVEFGKGSRYILLNGNIHAREYITTNYLLEVLDEYAYAYVKDEKIGKYRVRPLLDAFTLVIIPCSNPDGRAIAIDQDPEYKNNANNVNLNQNFPTNWYYNESGEYGPYAGSEPETQVLMSVMRQYPFELVLDCHTAGNVLYYSDDDCSEAQTARARSLADAMSAESGYLPMTFMANSGMANYARHPYGVLGLTVEMWPTYEHPIDCSGFYSKIWNCLSTMPGAVMTWLKNH